MEKKTTQRIIGIIVAIVLIIILLPLLYHRNNNFTQTALTKEPSFPDEQTQPLSEKNIDQAQPTTASNTESENAKTVNAESVQPVANATQQQETPKQIDNNSAPQNLSEDQPSSKNSPEKIDTISQNESSPVKEQKTNNDQTAPKQEQASSEQNNSGVISAQYIPKVRKIVESASSTKKPVSAELKKSAWVVQLGSFADKNNARRLADKLRAAGYKAFMKEVKAENGSTKQTRVYIGPEFKQASAMKLSKKIEQQMNLRGFIVLYKPLEL